jgi:hypothetical protein
VANVKVHFAKPPRIPTTRQKISRIAFGSVQGRRQTTADTQIAALLKNYAAQARASAEIHRALGLHSVAERATPTATRFHAQSQAYHRYP